MSSMSSSTPNISKSIDGPNKKKKIAGKSGLSGHCGGRSEVWSCFEKIIDEESKKWTGNCKCNYCSKIVFSPASLGTNKLWTHRNNCKELPSDLKDKGQTTLTVLGGAFNNWKFDQEKARRALAIMIIMDGLPFSTVENEGFIAFCAELQPKFHLVSRPTITKDCYQIFLDEKVKMKTYLNETSTRVSITTDMWTSIQNLGYMVITAHFVDKQWNLRKKIINFCVVPHPHKGEALAKVIESCLLEWGLEKVISITLDNAKNNDTCVDDLKKRLNRRKMLLLEGEFLHVRCLAHVMNLVVRAGIDELEEIIIKIRKSVKYIRSSSSRFQMFKKCIEEEKLVYKNAVCLDVKTRWNSTYLMIDSVLSYVSAFDRLEEQDNSYLNGGTILDTNDWKKLKSLHSFLEEFYLLTKRISGSHYVSSHTYFDEISFVKVLLTREMKSDDEDRRSMATKMHAKFDLYLKFDKLNPIFLASVVLDPRNKLEYLELWYEKLLEDDTSLSDKLRKEKVDSFVQSVKSFMSRLYETYKNDVATREVEESTNSTQATTKSEVVRGNDIKDEIRAKLKRKNTMDALSDLDRYLYNDGIEDGGPNFDILGWWKNKIATYRTVAIMARDILSIPITSVASESAFSSAGRVLDQFRSSLTPTIVEGLVCAQDWLKSGPLVNVEEDFENLTFIENSVQALRITD